MDFFQHQDEARKKTKLLVFYFVLAVVLIVLAVYLAVAVIFLNVGGGGRSAAAGLWNPELFLWVSLGTLAVILLGSFFKIISLGDGGETVARSLGGRQISPETRDLNERKLLNIVEEMAIASGMAVPPVYLLEEEAGINAFAAGFTPDDAVIGVTRGCAEKLNRDQLQGVVAHEFSHILNGDMRLNLRLIGLIYGILAIAMIGRVLLRVRPSSGRGKKGGGAAIVLLGLALFLIGYIGVFFGKLIKSAVSRQREFLADAAAVQFTRNPLGIAGALKRIWALSTGSLIANEHAEEASHLFFGDALAPSFLDMMATHPPLPVRIRRLDPSFVGNADEAKAVQLEIQELAARQPQEEARPAPARRPAMVPGLAAAHESYAFQPEELVSRVGVPGVEDISYASALVSAAPETLVAAVRQPFDAVAVTFALLLNPDEDARAAQLGYLQAHAPRPLLDQTRKLLTLTQDLSPEARLPLVEMALPTLRSLSPGQYRSFRETVHQLVMADRKVTVFEYALQTMMLQSLGRHFEGRKAPGVQYFAMRALLPSCAGLLSTLAYIGQRSPEQAQAAFAQGARKLGADGASLGILSRADCGLERIDRALGVLVAASPQLKKRVLDACAACVAADGRITVEEAELLRTIASALGCPVPPLMSRLQAKDVA
jgi:Zn-dependent protease with chaperone function